MNTFYLDIDPNNLHQTFYLILIYLQLLYRSGIRVPQKRKCRTAVQATWRILQRGWRQNKCNENENKTIWIDSLVLFSYLVPKVTCIPRIIGYVESTCIFHVLATCTWIRIFHVYIPRVGNVYLPRSLFFHSTPALHLLSTYQGNVYSTYPPRTVFTGFFRF